MIKSCDQSINCSGSFSKKSYTKYRSYISTSSIRTEKRNYIPVRTELVEVGERLKHMNTKISLNMNKRIIISILTLLLSLPLHSAILIQGDINSPTKSFSFTVNKNIFSPSGNFYESANEIITEDQQFTLSRLIRGATAFTPLMPPLVTLNNQPETENPLFGDKIIQLGILETEDGLFMRDMPVVVGENKPYRVYLFENIQQFNNTIVIPSGDVHDANGAVSPGIVALTTNISSNVFAAVKPNGGEFGQDNSGIALLVRGIADVMQGETPIKARVFGEINANTGSVKPPQALRLDPTSPAIFIGNTLQSIATNHAVMHWDTILQRLYIGLSVVANNGATDGARSVAVVKFIENGAITLETIAPNSAF